MKREHCEELMFAIQAAYPGRVVFTEEAIEVWSRLLEDLPVELAARAVERLCKTSKHPPSIADIRKSVVELADPIPGAEEAWIEVRQAARRFNPYASQRIEWSCPVVAKAVAAMGGIEAIAHSDAIEVMAGQFRRAYEGIAEREIIRRQLTFGEQPDLRLLPGGA